MLAGKDRGKQGRVLDARPRDGKVVVENLNIAKRHTEAAADARRLAAWAARRSTPGGIIDRCPRP